MRLPPSKLNPCCNNNYLELAPAVDRQYSAMTEMHRFFFLVIATTISFILALYFFFSLPVYLFFNHFLVLK